MLSSKFLLLIGNRRGFAERPVSKKIAAIKKLQNEVKEVTVKEIKLPEIGGVLKNVNVFTGQADPVLLPDSEYPDWIWNARGPCRAAKEIEFEDSAYEATTTEIEEMAKLKKYLRSENRKEIRRKNELLKGSSQ